MRRAYNGLRAIVDRVVAVELWVAVALFGLTGVVIAVEIVARRVFNLPFVWAEDLTVFLFVWTSFLGAAVLYHRREAMSIDTLTSRLSERTQARLVVVVDVVLFVALLYLARLSYDFFSVQRNLGHKLGGATGLPSYAMTLAVLTGMTTMLVSTVTMLMKHCIPAGEGR
jgi:TRAP-type C4-dicarboxylate transport system permease small subunit